MNNKQRQSRRRHQKGGSGCAPLNPAPLVGGRRQSRKQRKQRKQSKNKKGGISGSLATLGLLGTLLAIGSKKRRGTRKGMRRKTARRAYVKRRKTRKH